MSGHTRDRPENLAPNGHLKYKMFHCTWVSIEVSFYQQIQSDIKHVQEASSPDKLEKICSEVHVHVYGIKWRAQTMYYSNIIICKSVLFKFLVNYERYWCIVADE